ncbi:tetratricopeptide repeat protein 27 [Phymastichus coffea]|uniref:tetratricopeptide repeat protein 27 n=1 Tax=Phymastichus coffea TaxID=108790 RepID=UPI00273B8892|nr:tetratricopeptide repeat protein 27 [Phymastichus coffea]
MEKTIKKIEHHLLLNIPLSESGNQLYKEKEIIDGDYELVFGEFFIAVVLPMMNNDFQYYVNNSINSNKSSHNEWFNIGVGSLLYFIQNNWTGPFINEQLDNLLPLQKLAITSLSLQDQLNENITKIELLYLAKIILANEQLQKSFPSTFWWLLRSNYIHQLILEEASAVLFNDSENLIKQIIESNIVKDDALKTLFNVEVAQFYSYYTRIQTSEQYLENALATAKLNLKLLGALGKRTKYQEQEKPQLYLKLKVDKEFFPYRKCDKLPKVINLSDDLRLEKIEFSEKVKEVELGSIEETVIMAKCFQLKVSQPKDELTDEEIITYLNSIIDNTKNWSLKVSSLYQRCLIESTHKRTIERSLSQLEYLIEQLKSKKTPVSYRMDLFFASGMNSIWTFKQQLANTMFNLGMIKGALDLYLNQSLWEDVIVCYTVLEMKHKAAEVIRQQLDKKPTVKLWCLLGDATQEVQHYETAWKLSGEKSSRVQRHLGFYYYAKQQYTEAIPHLKLSVELNHMQENVWIRLGFAALQIEDWKLAASSYRKYTSLEQSSFEVWNNLAKTYIKLGDKSRAWRALQDAIKCNFDKWEIWDNLMIVSTDLGYFGEVIRCYHRILDIKGEHIDIEVLTILSKAIINNLNDADRNPSQRNLQKALELFGRITASVSSNSDIWRLYAELTLQKNNEIDNQKAAQYFQRAYRAAVADSRWFKNVKDANNVLDTCVRLAEANLYNLHNVAVAHKRTILGSAKLSLQSVVKKIKDLNWEDQSGILENLEKVENKLKLIVDELEKLKTT